MISMRPMAAADVRAVRTLLGQLGYEIEPAEVARRYRAVAEADGHAAIVAEQQGRMVGFLHMYVRPAFEKPPEVVVQALVVAEECRGTGIGKTLMSAAEAWASERGFASVALSSRTSRFDAHRFYGALGYRREATSYLMRKKLGSDT